MQVTVVSYDEPAASGVVVTDAGQRLPVNSAAVRAGGLRRLRPGQRLEVVQQDGVVVSAAIPGDDLPHPG